MSVRAVLAVALLIALVGCGSRTPEPTVTPAPTPTAPSTPTPAQTTERTATLAATPTVSVPDSPPEPIVAGIIDAGPEFIGFTSLEERIFRADVIVRAKLRSLRSSAKRSDRWSYEDQDRWIPVIVFEFEALEFLKGAEEETLLANASFGGSGDSWQSSYEVYESERDAIAAALYRISKRDEPWDEREAIVFMSRDQYWGSESYGFTLAGSIQAPEYQLESRYNRVWLPADDATSQTPERFLMTAPPGDTGKEARDAATLEEVRRQLSEQFGTSSSPELDRIIREYAEQNDLTIPESENAPWRVARESITLEELREAIAELEASISRAEAGVIPRYEDCLVAKYKRERMNQQAIYEGGELIRHWWQHYAPPPPVRKVLFAGLPAQKTVLGEIRIFTAISYVPGFRDRLWLDGPDAHLFQLQPDSESDQGGQRHRIVASEALSAGSYHFELHVHEALFQPCGYYDELSATDYFIEVVAPEEPGRPEPRYANCVMGSAGVLAPESGRESFPFQIDSSSECGSTQRESSRSHYEVFEVRERIEVDALLSHVCPSIRLFVHEGVGPEEHPPHSVGTNEFLRNGVRHTARFGVLSPGTYTFELNVLNSEECYSRLYFSWYPKQP